MLAGLQIRVFPQKGKGRFNSYTPPPILVIKKRNFMNWQIKKFIIYTICVFSFNYGLAQSCLFAQEGVSIDACLRTLYKWTESNDTTRHTFSLRNAFLGFTKNMNKYIAARIYIDVGDTTGKPAYDLYAALKPTPWEIRIGQFKQGLGIEMLLPTPKLDFIESSLIGKMRTPKDLRDLGIQLLYRDKGVEAWLACVNGTGKNVLQDDNNWKDLSGRLAFQQKDFILGGNFYYGKIGPDTLLRKYRRWAGEMAIKTPLELTTELLYMDDTLKGKGFYLSLIYRRKQFCPLFRYDWLEYNNSEKEALTFGINFLPLKENLKLGINYIREDKQNWRILSQFQIAY